MIAESPGAGVQAAAPPAHALASLGFDDEVADLRGQAALAAPQQAARDDPGGDAIGAGQVHQARRRLAVPAASPQVSQRGEIRVVIEQHRRAAAERLGDPGLQGDVAPAEGGGRTLSCRSWLTPTPSSSLPAQAVDGGQHPVRADLQAGDGVALVVQIEQADRPTAPAARRGGDLRDQLAPHQVMARAPCT